MNIYYNTQTGEILDWVLKKDLFLYSPPREYFAIYSIDEVKPSNVVLCLDGYLLQRRRDINGFHKYYIELTTRSLMERGDWEEVINA